MKAHLLSRAEDLDLERALPWNAEALRQDLRLDVLLDAMAGDDAFLREVSERVLLAGLADADAIAYRQDVLRDCLEHPDVVRDLYAVATEAAQAQRKVFLGVMTDTPESVVHRSLRVMRLLLEGMVVVRAIADEHGERLRSEGFRGLAATIAAELDDDYLAEVRLRLKQLEFPGGLLMSAELGAGNRGRRHILRHARRLTWRERLPFGERSSHGFQIPDRDDDGLRALTQLRGRGLVLAADALGQATEHVLSFFAALQAEVGFYVACLNLHAALTARGEPTCLPSVALDAPTLSGAGLYDPCLALASDARVVGNDLDAPVALTVVTGANQGGKSTLLRSVGLAQLMLQSGMFVAAASWTADLRDGVFTHFKREEDAGMRHGKLDEELVRMSEIVEHMRSGALLLCNESFASTNEREGSEIARGVITALVGCGVKVVVVTHLHELARGLHDAGEPPAVFLRAARDADGGRSFRVAPGAPLPTSYGEDLYRRIFGKALDEQAQRTR
jgi:hypothetical protein